jgi:hypothetical protein
VIRLFKVYYPLRTLVLLVGEALIVWTSFLLATIWRNQDSWLLLNVDGGYLQVLAVLGPKILTVTGVVLLLSHACSRGFAVSQPASRKRFGVLGTHHPDLHFVLLARRVCLDGDAALPA